MPRRVGQVNEVAGDHLVQPEERRPEGRPVTRDRDIPELARQGRPGKMPRPHLQVRIANTLHDISAHSDGGYDQVVHGASGRWYRVGAHRERPVFGALRSSRQCGGRHPTMVWKSQFQRMCHSAVEVVAVPTAMSPAVAARVPHVSLSLAWLRCSLRLVPTRSYATKSSTTRPTVTKAAPVSTSQVRPVPRRSRRLAGPRTMPP